MNTLLLKTENNQELITKIEDFVKTGIQIVSIVPMRYEGYELTHIAISTQQLVDVLIIYQI